jgi:plastocyanin
MKTKWLFALALVGLAPWVVPGAAQAQSTYNVLVGAQDTSLGADVDAFFPDTLQIHVGDTVHWKRNANEVHTVSFLAGTPMPDLVIPAPNGLPAPLMLNPVAAYPAAPANGQYDGTTFANSGIIGPDPAQADSFDLTFTTPGTYNYVCIVHGVTMSGKILVVDNQQNIPSPSDVDQQATRSIDAALAQAPIVLALASFALPPPTANPDGTTTYQVQIGYTFGQLDLLHFFPDQLAVNPGDTVVFTLGDANMAPHTVTFLNGNMSPDDFLPVPQNNGPPLLVFNPAVFFPQNPGQPLTKDGIYSSGLLAPGGATTSFSIQIGGITGQIQYQCLLHDASGMLGSLQIVPR